jgi:uncharacterized protein (TIGR03067 family)
MHATLLILLATTLGAPTTKEKEKDTAKDSIVGEWEGVKASANGMELPVPAGGIKFEFTADGKMMVHEGKKDKPDAGTYTVDAKKNPAEVDLVPPADKKEPTVQGIYKVEGDELTLCFSRGPDGKAARPTKFEAPAGSQSILITLKRVKK